MTIKSCLLFINQWWWVIMWTTLPAIVRLRIRLFILFPLLRRLVCHCATAKLSSSKFIRVSGRTSLPLLMGPSKFKSYTSVNILAQYCYLFICLSIQELSFCLWGFPCLCSIPLPLMLEFHLIFMPNIQMCFSFDLMINWLNTLEKSLNFG